MFEASHIIFPFNTLEKGVFSERAFDPPGVRLFSEGSGSNIAVTFEFQIGKSLLSPLHHGRGRGRRGGGRERGGKRLRPHDRRLAHHGQGQHREHHPQNPCHFQIGKIGFL